MNTNLFKYTLFDGIEQMLAPKTLSALTGRTVTQVHTSPVDGGASGARLLAVDAINGATSLRYILKRMSAEWDWFIANDQNEAFREVYRGLMEPVNGQVRAAVRWL